jgi:hypothetical protein
MSIGPMPADHTEVGGVPGSFNENDEIQPRSARNEHESMQPVEQHSPTKVRVPGWRVFVLGGSGGIH